MARDAIARLYDVEKNTVELDIKAGTITFYPKKGKSIDLEKIHDSLKATRLSGNTGMRVNSLEITAIGKLVSASPDAGPEKNGERATLLQVAGITQQFLLVDHDSKREEPRLSPLQRLREALERGERIVSVTGRVDGWNSSFPPFLNAQLPPGVSGKPYRLIVIDFQTKGG